MGTLLKRSMALCVPKRIAAMPQENKSHFFVDAPAIDHSEQPLVRKARSRVKQQLSAACPGSIINFLGIQIHGSTGAHGR
jgi:hypothetical protein